MHSEISYVFGSALRALLTGFILTLGVACLLLQLVTSIDLSITLFSLSCLLLLLSIFFGKLSWFYSIFAGQFLLGVWLKALIHRGLDSPYIEPTGGFLFSEAHWREFCLYASCAALGLALGRLMAVIATARSLTSAERSGPTLATPTISGAHWVSFLTASCVVYYLNEMFSIYVSGVNPKLTLPIGLNAPVSFIIFIGIPLTLCTILSFDVQARGRLTLPALFSVLTLLLVSSVSTASRAPLVTQAVPILLASLLMQRAIGRVTIRWSIFITWLLFLVTSLTLVSVMRIFAYIDGAVLDADAALFYLEQTVSLFLDRWLGAEAIMSAVGAGGKSLGMFFALMTEDPAAGTDSLYQQISGSLYVYSADFTFATWPGFLGIVSLSGSASFVLVSSGCIVVLGQLLERVLSFLLGPQRVTIALAASTVSFWVYQTTVPRLFLPFLFQLIVFTALLGLLGRRVSRAKRVRATSAPRLSFE